MCVCVIYVYIYIYYFSILYNLIHFSSQTLKYTEWATHQIFCVFDIRKKKSFNSNLYFIVCYPNFL